MSANLHGKVAIVTGVSNEGQVGQAVARALAARGASLAICARTEANVVARAAELKAEGANVIPVVASLTDEAQVKRLVDETLSALGRIDIVVNIAGGLSVYKPSAEVEVNEWTREVNNNVLSAFLVTRAAFPHMAKSGGGSIINFARAGNAQANMLPYNVAKAGVVALTRTFALEGKDAHIRVNAVAPGLVDTGSNVAMMQPKDTSNWAKRDEIADAVAFLSGDQSIGITGQVLEVTGWGYA
ncbi:SDR family NAD(P)-dependent oxidoreductase [Hyphomicrobium sp. D-2]|uniref:SDR family NAD(P)-dependent oxidoreductase n=1 Tax=Hyphomicrobium sp. D-2 TaxID=3041621 RepID=UPI002455DEA4|nr:SDR family NAD(P)-dependent oxidoreductase [Hyphomicrobium sp. D-2]MDH4981142.1 SDR family NAD(P)-dependent oxidoreductase [Hyphomicrobium sp. D-2]